VGHTQCKGEGIEEGHTQCTGIEGDIYNVQGIKRGHTQCTRDRRGHTQCKAIEGDTFNLEGMEGETPNVQGAVKIMLKCEMEWND
jgi:hypothetical protein